MRYGKVIYCWCCSDKCLLDLDLILVHLNDLTSDQTCRPLRETVQVSSQCAPLRSPGNPLQSVRSGSSGWRLVE